MSTVQAESAIYAALLNLLCAAWAQDLFPLRCVSKKRIDYCCSLAITHRRLHYILRLNETDDLVPELTLMGVSCAESPIFQAIGTHSTTVSAQISSSRCRSSYNTEIIHPRN